MCLDDPAGSLGDQRLSRMETGKIGGTRSLIAEMNDV
jgi:hypothetical protein